MRLFCKLISSILTITTVLSIGNNILAAKSNALSESDVTVKSDLSTKPNLTAKATKFNALQDSVFMKADKVEYSDQDQIITAKGNIVIKFENYLLKADYIYYDIKKDQLFAEGNIFIKDNKNHVVIGERAIFNNRLKKGIINEFILKVDDSYLMARIVRRIDESKSHLYKATFTPCNIHCGREPIWKISAKDAFVDFDNHQVIYSNIFFQVYGVPIAYSPYFSHATPNAPAKTGVLVPSMKRGSLIVPFYFRLRDNIDFTISPRVADKYTIFEFEWRHKFKEGSYKINGSVGNVPRYLEKQGRAAVIQKTTPQYHLFASGNFKHNDLNYGFDIRRTSSDKAYLKNYHQIFDSYLTSKVFANKVDGKNYISINGVSFQDLRVENVNNKTPIIFPSVDYKTVIPISIDESANISINNKAIIYTESDIKQIGRNALEVIISKNIQTDFGQIIDIGISNRMDVYYSNIKNNTNSSAQNIQNTGNNLNNNLNNNTPNNVAIAKDGTKETQLFRNIPEIFAMWRYPFMSNISAKSSLKIEPMVSTVIGRSYEDRFKKFNFVDVSKFDLSEEILFRRNRFSGIDNHEYGSRLNYGTNVSLYSNMLYLNTFLGQMVYRNNLVKNNNYEYVGSVSIELIKQILFEYKFRKNKKLAPIRDEIEFNYNNSKLSFRTQFITLYNVSKYFAQDDFNVKKNKVKNLMLDTSYKVTDNLSISGSAVWDLSAHGNFNLLTRTIGVTYFKDCVNISGNFSDDFTQDKVRGVHKVRSQSFTVGLKVLNM